MNTIAALFYAAVTAPQRILLTQAACAVDVAVSTPRLRRMGFSNWDIFQGVLDHWAECSVDSLRHLAGTPQEWIDAREDDETLRLVLLRLLFAGLLFSVAAHFIR